LHLANEDELKEEQAKQKGAEHVAYEELLFLKVDEKQFKGVNFKIKILHQLLTISFYL
jgi:hypothetical protein